MGKCKKCGVEVPKEAMFCPNCGAGVSKEASVEKLSGGKGRRKKKYAMIGGGIGAILFILLVIFVSTRPKVIDLNECRKIEIDGYDGVGNGNVYVGFRYNEVKRDLQRTRHFFYSISRRNAPTFFSTGRLSPVMADSSTEPLPDTTTPSTGILPP